MRKTREILRLKWHKGRSHRAVVTALNIGLGTVSEVVGRARRAGITSWQEVDALSEEELEARMYPSTATGAPRPLPSPAAIHIELRRKGVTLRLLHEEYFLSNPNGYGYTKFVELYNTWVSVSAMFDMATSTMFGRRGDRSRRRSDHRASMATRGAAWRARAG